MISVLQYQNIRKISKRLEKRYDNFTHYNKNNPLNELVFIICSLRTQETSYQSVYSNLKKEFPTFGKLLSASLSGIEKAIHSGGLSKQKALTLKTILNYINQVFGKPTLSELKKYTDEECEKFLLSLHGVGLKTARCVMMYSLGRKVFPVDTHVWRLSKRLGWINSKRDYRNCSDKEMNQLQAFIPPHLRFSLHVNMISLGREICTSSNPHCSICPIKQFCPKIIE